jgi:hypothetical protein
MQHGMRDCLSNPSWDFVGPLSTTETRYETVGKASKFSSTSPGERAREPHDDDDDDDDDDHQPLSWLIGIVCALYIRSADAHELLAVPD